MKNELQALLRDRIDILDGAMGAMIQSDHLSEDDFREDRFKDHESDLSGNNDLLVLPQPAIIQTIYTAYLDAGSDILETNTFNSNALSLTDYNMSELAYEMNHTAAELAKSYTVEATNKGPEQPRNNKVKVDWDGYVPPEPVETGIKVLAGYDVVRIVELIDWGPLFCDLGIGRSLSPDSGRRDRRSV